MAHANTPCRYALVIACCITTLLVGLLALSLEQRSLNDRPTAAAFAEPEEHRPDPSGLASDLIDITQSGPGREQGPHTAVLTPSNTNQPQTAAAAFAETVWQAQRQNSSFERLEAIAELGDWRNAGADSVLIDLLSDPNPTIRESVVEALGGLATPRATQGLGYALNDSDPLVRRTAVELLAEIGTRTALSALAIALNDPAADVRLAAVYELADNHTLAASALMQRFLSDADPRVKGLAAEYLGE